MCTPTECRVTGNSPAIINSNPVCSHGYPRENNKKIIITIIIKPTLSTLVVGTTEQWFRQTTKPLITCACQGAKSESTAISVLQNCGSLKRIKNLNLQGTYISTCIIN
jgi:hypothetical protein